MPNTNKKIKIDVETGGSNGSELDGCYFQQDEAPATTYSFYDKGSNSTELATGITSGADYTFSFNFPGETDLWTIKVNINAAAFTASGDWSDQPQGAEEVEPESGTFTAQAEPIEDEASSSAYA